MSVLEVPRVFSIAGIDGIGDGYSAGSDVNENGLGAIEHKLLELLESNSGNVRLSGGGMDVSLPPSLGHAVVTFAAALAQGQKLAVSPVGEYVTTQKAAELLGVSRPTIVRMIDAGRLPCRRVNSHRRIPLAAVERELALDELFAASEAVGAEMGTVSPEEAIDAIKRIRARR